MHSARATTACAADVSSVLNARLNVMHLIGISRVAQRITQRYDLGVMHLTREVAHIKLLSSHLGMRHLTEGVNRSTLDG